MKGALTDVQGSIRRRSWSLPGGDVVLGVGLSAGEDWCAFLLGHGRGRSSHVGMMRVVACRFPGDAGEHWRGADRVLGGGMAL